MRIQTFVASLAIAALCVPAAAQEEEHFDVYLARPTAGSQTVFGGVVEGGLVPPVAGLRVFEAEFGRNPLDGNFFGDEPGFNNPGTSGIQAPGAAALEPGDAFSVAEQPITLAGVTSGVFFWNGVGAVSFAAAPGVSFEIGNPAGAAAADGSFDDHPLLTLDDIGGSGFTFPAEGIYLASFTATLPGLDPTDPLFLVIGTNGLITAEFLGITESEFLALTDVELEEALDGLLEPAVAFVESTLTIPEPASAAFATMAAVAAMAARSRR